MTRGRFITFEGLDGAGKSTQLGWFVDRLRSLGIRVCATREPGGTPLGEQLRALLLDIRQRMDPETETLLMFAARREHIAAVIEPALARGDWVVCDRFTDATFAYQGGGRRVPWERLEILEKWVQGSLRPDLTLYFDVAPEVGQARAGAIKAPDRFESEAADFHRRVRQGYLRRATESGGRVHVLDAGRSIADIQKELEVILSTL